jgi:hypothetical protein
VIIKAKFVPVRQQIVYDAARKGEITFWKSPGFDISNVNGRLYDILFSSSPEETEKIASDELIAICIQTMEDLQERTNNYFEYSISVHNDNGLLHAHCLTSGLLNLSPMDLKELKRKVQDFSGETIKTREAAGL